MFFLKKWFAVAFPFSICGNHISASSGVDTMSHLLAQKSFTFQLQPGKTIKNFHHCFSGWAMAQKDKPAIGWSAILGALSGGRRTGQRTVGWLDFGCGRAFDFLYSWKPFFFRWTQKVSLTNCEVSWPETTLLRWDILVGPLLRELKMLGFLVYVGKTPPVAFELAIKA